MADLIRKLFNIYPGEEKNALHFVVLGLLWSFAVSLGWKNADALFLLYVGADHLPSAYAIIAGFMIAIASVMLYAFHHFYVHRILLSWLACGVVFYSLAFFCLYFHYGTESKWLWYALRVFGWIFFSVVNTSFWTFIDQFYHLRDSKRLFALFSSAIFVGIACTGIMMQGGWLEFYQVVAIIITLLLMTSFWTLRIVKKIAPINNDEESIVASPVPDQSWRHALAAILSSKFTIYLMVFSILSYISLFLTEYNYMFSFQEIFGGGFVAPASPDEDAPLVLFLGKCIAGASIFNIIFGLFFYSRAARRVGVNNLLLVTPLLLVFIYLGWPFSSTLLFFPVLAFFVCESTYYVLDENNFNLLLNGIPVKVKYITRVCIESFFEPIGTLTCAILLTMFPDDARLLALTIGIGMLTICFIVRMLYPKAVYLNLMDNAVHFEKSPKAWLEKLPKKERKSAESRLLAILKLGNMKAHDFALEGLIDFEDPMVIDKLLAIVDHLGPKTKELFIEKISASPFAKEIRIVDQLLTWDQEDIDPNLRATLHLYLAKHGLLSPQKAFLHLKNPDPKLKAAAIITFRLSTTAAASPFTPAEMQALAAEQLQELLISDDVESIRMGLYALSLEATQDDINRILPFLNHPSILVARQAAKAIAEIATHHSVRHTKTLLNYVTRQSDTEFRLALITAIGKMADTSLVGDIVESALHFRPSERRAVEKILQQMGLKIVPTLLSIGKDVSLHDRSRLLAGRVLGRLALPQLRANLHAVITHEIDRAYFYFYHYHTLQTSYPDYDLHVLKDTLLARYHSILDFIIQMLGTAFEVEDSELLSRSLRSTNPKVRSQVLETLERTCEPALFRLIQPLVDELPLHEKLKKEPLEKLSLPELLNKLSSSPALVDQVAAAAISSTLQLSGWRANLKQQMVGKEEIFHHFAYELLET